MNQPEWCSSPLSLGPGPKGRELANRARMRRPELRVVYLTGDSTLEWQTRGVPFSRLVSQPFCMGEVAAALAAAASRPAA